MAKLVMSRTVDFGTTFGTETDSNEKSFGSKKEAYEAGVNWLLKSAPSSEGIFTFNSAKMLASYTDANGLFDDMWVNVVD